MSEIVPTERMVEFTNPTLGYYFSSQVRNQSELVLKWNKDRIKVHNVNTGRTRFAEFNWLNLKHWKDQYYGIKSAERLEGPVLNNAGIEIAKLKALKWPV